MFHASFDTPRLEFICNHDAILYLTIKEGHYYLDFAKAPGPFYPDRDRTKALNDVEISFRVAFDVRPITGNDSKIGIGKSVIRLLVLDLPKAKFIPSSKDSNINEAALEFYLRKYLVFLHSAGHHVLFSLPEFDEDGRSRLLIDYSSMGNAFPDLDEIQGISVDLVNTQLSSNWLKAAMQTVDVVDEIHDWREISLAEYRSTFNNYQHMGSDVHFHAKLGAPTLTAVCAQEATIIFTLEEVLFYNDIQAAVDRKHSHKFAGWKIALMTEIIRIDEVDGAIFCKIDTEKIRVYEELSLLAVDEGDDIAVSYTDSLLEAFLDEYISVMQTMGRLVIYDSRWSTTTVYHILNGDSVNEEDFSSWELEQSTTGPSSNRFISWKSMITRTEMHGFDQVTAVSQSSINSYFRSLWHVAKTSKKGGMLYAWSSGPFSATFKPWTVRILSNRRAIIWINLEALKLEPTGDQPSAADDRHEFENWQLAFEVNIKIATFAEMYSKDSSSSFKTDSAVFKQYGDQQDCTLNHIFLDFMNAEFLHEYSRLDDLLRAPTRRSIESLRAVLSLVRRSYLPALHQWGFSILHTIPIWNHGTLPPTYALTQAEFQIYSDVTVTRQNCLQAMSSIMEPVILILGMTGFRPMPSTHLQFSANWVVRVSEGVSSSTLALSREILLDKGLLVLLAQINAVTTIVPVMTHIDDKGVWKPTFTTWAHDPQRTGQRCPWTPERLDVDVSYRYKWEHQVSYTYEHKGSGVVQGEYSVSCITRNYVELPAAIRSGTMTITVGGEVTLHVTYGTDTRTGSAKSSAKWSASLVLHTEPGGIKATVTGSTSPIFTKPAYSGDLAAMMYNDLDGALSIQNLLPTMIDFKDVLQDFKQFEGMWQSCYPGLHAYCLANPVFNARGDLLFELRSYNAQQSSVSGPSPGQTTTRSARGRARPFASRVFRNGRTESQFGGLHVETGAQGYQSPMTSRPPSGMSFNSRQGSRRDAGISS
ncbi:uncharacterized protein FIBRA_07356 [Fibroporia radiculosa]|uniref:Uncharacterized protein n=1 Tax=Fibroporia radiculosa TaxID=599839 RepID=J4I0J5_9APHY|nr:uncharacterized protein FIBRA_07356 [Fibroporia radiculosa]CCM05147.1 predicted protein [Fibroporia radiculosa]